MEDQTALLAREVLARTKEPMMRSACWEYACDCHDDAKTLAGAFLELLDVVAEAQRVLHYSKVDPKIQDPSLRRSWGAGRKKVLNFGIVA